MELGKSHSSLERIPAGLKNLLLIQLPEESRVSGIPQEQASLDITSLTEDQQDELSKFLFRMGQEKEYCDRPDWPKIVKSAKNLKDKERNGYNDHKAEWVPLRGNSLAKTRHSDRICTNFNFIGQEVTKSTGCSILDSIKDSAGAMLFYSTEDAIRKLVEDE